MDTNILINGVEIYHPETAVDNKFIIDNFNKKDIEVKGLMNYLGREIRYLANPKEENLISMCTEAAEKVLALRNIHPDDLDMIVCVTDTPEYTMPTNALIIHNKLKATNAHITFDLNDNCIGMINGLDVVSRYMMTNPRIKRALLVGGIFISAVSRENDPIVYPNIADGAAAMILEKEEAEIKTGFIDSFYHTESHLYDKIVLPACGISSLYDDSIQLEDKKMKWIGHDVSYFSDEWKKLILNLLVLNNEDIDDISHFLFSQFAKTDVEITFKKMDVSLDKLTFIGDKYGYTGCASPIFALYEALKNERIKKGDKVIFCSVGAGYTMSAVLYKF